MDIKKYGLILEALNSEDWKFGASKLGLEKRDEDGDWTVDLPTGELQRRNDIDKMACVTYSALNCIETDFNYKIRVDFLRDDDMIWLKDNGYLDENGKLNFSERFTAKLSGTGHNGNSFKSVAEAIRKTGLIPEKVLPYNKNMSWDEYYNGITSEMLKLGREFIKHFPINYESVDKFEFPEALKYSPVQVAIHAYNGVNNGIYIKTGNTINHAVMLFKPNYIFDSYEENNNYYKQLAKDFIYMSYGFRYIITTKKKEDMPLPQNNLITTPSNGYLKRDIAKIVIPVGTPINKEDMFNEWIPWDNLYDKKQQASLNEKLTFVDLFSLFIKKLFNK